MHALARQRVPEEIITIGVTQTTSEPFLVDVRRAGACRRADQVLGGVSQVVRPTDTSLTPPQQRTAPRGRNTQRNEGRDKMPVLIYAHGDST